jgi:glycosyltransferase involved in cell wall biosynthesis
MTNSAQKLIVVYSAHTPFIKAAEYAKKFDKNIKICLYVADLPQYMNLTEKRGFIYNTAKKYDISTMIKHMRCVDSYVLLTEAMKNALPVGTKPYEVVEGIVNLSESEIDIELPNENRERYIVYTGKLDEKFGIGALLDSVSYFKDENIKLVLCGLGDLYEKAVLASEKDKRIIPLGQVSPQEAKKWRNKASVLVNPRSNSEEYTKYSFPSKNIEYILSGKPVVAYMLDGMPELYRNFIFEISSVGNPAEDIAKAIQKALDDTVQNAENRKKEYLSYAAKHLSSKSIANKIIKMNF